MLRNPTKRPVNWTEIPLGVRTRASRNHCEVCGVEYGRCCAVERGGETYIAIQVQQIDHLIPRRWLLDRGINPHQLPVLISVCGSCHGKKKVYEDALFRGDVFAYLTGLRSVGFPIARVINFAAAHGLKEFEGWRI